MRRHSKQQHDLERKIGILSIFAEASRLWHGGKPDNTILAPPWYERVTDRRTACGYRLVPRGGYGPRTSKDWERMRERWAEGRASGGLWDHAMDRDYGPRECMDGMAGDYTKPVRSADRRDPIPDRQTVDRYVAKHSASIPAQELEVYFAVYRDGLRIHDVASRLGINRNAADHALWRLRRRVKNDAA